MRTYYKRLEEAFENGIWNDFFAKSERKLFLQYYNTNKLVTWLIAICHTTWLYISTIVYINLSFMDLYVFIAGLLGHYVGVSIIIRERFKELDNPLSNPDGTTTLVNINTTFQGDNITRKLKGITDEMESAESQSLLF